jgi:hypothetical protein
VAFAGINYWAVGLAAVVGWLVGLGWYSALKRPWMIALGKTRTELLPPHGKPSPAPFLVALAAQLVMAWVLAGIIGHVGHVTVPNAVISSLLAWLGFVVTTRAADNCLARQRVMLTTIESGQWLLALLAQGIVIGLFGA